MSDQSTPARVSLPAFEVRDVPGFSGYRTGDNGTVWSCRVRTRGRHGGQSWHNSGNWRALRPEAGHRGHLRVHISIGGERKKVLVHHMVLWAFCGTCPPGMECRHLNGNPSDNRPENLCWGTVKENRHDAIMHGTQVRGEGNAASRLQEEQVVKIIQKLIAGSPKGPLALEYGVSRTTINRIAFRRNWLHVWRRFDAAAKD
jgi:hypothetical protein